MEAAGIIPLTNYPVMIGYDLGTSKDWSSVAIFKHHPPPALQGSLPPEQVENLMIKIHFSPAAVDEMIKNLSKDLLTLGLVNNTIPPGVVAYAQKEEEMALKMGNKGPSYAEHLADPPQKVTKPIMGHVGVTKHKVGETPVTTPSETQVVHPGLFTTNGMSLTVEGGRTINLGNFESARIGVTLTLPCEPANLSEAYDWATEWVSGKVDEAIKQAKGTD